MFWIALAAQLSMPTVEGGGIWNLFSYDDIPMQLVPDGVAIRVGVRVTITPSGKIQSCQAEFSSGNPKLDSYTCAIILRRAKARPATGLDGLPTYGVVRTEVAWAVNAEPTSWLGDLDLQVQRLPNGIKDPAYVNVMFSVDEMGHPSACTQEEPEPPVSSKTSAELLQVACTELLKRYTAIPANDETGKPVRSVQNAAVRFSAKDRH